MCEHGYDTNLSALENMPIQVTRKKFDPEAGAFQYQLQFKAVVNDDEVRASVPVEVAFSIAENGDLADLSFMVPKSVRNMEAMSYINKEKSIQFIESRVFIVMPEVHGDTVLRAPADLELDSAGRIVSMTIH